MKRFPAVSYYIVFSRSFENNFVIVDTGVA